MKQALFTLLWIVAGIMLGFSIMAFDIILCFESGFEFLDSLSWPSVGFLSVAVFTESLIFWLSTKTKMNWLGVVSLFVCLALVGFGIEVSGIPDSLYYTGSDRFSELVYRRPEYKIFVLLLFVLPTIFWGYHAFKRRKGK